MRAKILPLYLSPDLYAELERRGRAEERDPIQQARFLLKQVLKDDAPRSADRAEPTAALEAAM